MKHGAWVEKRKHAPEVSLSSCCTVVKILPTPRPSSLSSRSVSLKSPKPTRHALWLTKSWQSVRCVRGVREPFFVSPLPCAATIWIATNAHEPLPVSSSTVNTELPHAHEVATAVIAANSLLKVSRQTVDAQLAVLRTLLPMTGRRARIPQRAALALQPRTLCPVAVPRQNALMGRNRTRHHGGGGCGRPARSLRRRRGQSRGAATGAR